MNPYTSFHVLRLMKDIEQVSTQLNQVFKASAEVKAECSLDTAVEASEELPGQRI